MTRISFYILNAKGEAERQAFACRLVEKIYHQGQQIYIHTHNAAHSKAVDEALWTYRAESFIPHDIHQVDIRPVAPILIGYGETTPPHLMDVLINLTDEQPLFFSQFNRVAEILDNTDIVKAAGRERYQFYKHRGYELDTHNI
jgi:DNA polymerase-3 subunit chi